MRRGARTFVIVGLIGLVLGSIAGKLSGVPFLNKAISVGLREPFFLDLSVLRFSISFLFDISIASIIGLLLALIIAARI